MQVCKMNLDTDPFLSVLDELDCVSLSLTSKLFLNIVNNCQIFNPYVDFSLKSNLKKYLALEFQHEPNVSLISRIVGNIYEKSRGVMGKSANYGRVFPMSAEIMAYAIENAAGKNVLEMAGASGENAILMAFTKAKKVFYNDITPEEVENFKKNCQSLPNKIKEKLEVVSGSVFDILKISPKIKNDIDLIICRNLIHFFNDKQLEDFFDVVNKTLKVGGRIIVEVNSKDVLLSGLNVYNDTASNFSFNMVQTFVHDYARGTAPQAVLYRAASVFPLAQISTDYKQIYLYLRKKETQGKWKLFPDAAGKEDFAQIEPAIRENIIKAFEAEKSQISKIQQGSVRVVCSSANAFNRHSLRKLFNSHGFKVEAIFKVSTSGHISQDKTEKGQIGIIAQRKS